MSSCITPLNPGRSALRALVAMFAAGAVFAPVASDAANATRERDGAVFATVSRGYKRVQLPDGTYQRETYAFGNGGCTAGPARDASIDELPFLAVAAELVEPLAQAGYVVSRDPRSTRLLLMVHWGTTPGVSDLEYAPVQNGPRAVVTRVTPPRTCAGGANPRCVGAVSPGFDRSELAAAGDTALAAFENRVRDRQLWHNAQILGYTEELHRVQALWDNPAGRGLRDGIVSDLEDSRYFVVLVAYDFQKAWKERKLEVQWSTRFSVRTRGHRFDAHLASMVAQAAPYFGRDSDGLVRGRRVAEGKVILGPTEVLGAEE